METGGIRTHDLRISDKPEPSARARAKGWSGPPLLSPAELQSPRHFSFNLAGVSEHRTRAPTPAWRLVVLPVAIGLALLPHRPAVRSIRGALLPGRLEQILDLPP